MTQKNVFSLSVQELERFIKYFIRDRFVNNKRGRTEKDERSYLFKRVLGYVTSKLKMLIVLKSVDDGL